MALALLPGAMTGCASVDPADTTVENRDEELTSNTASQRTVTLQGLFYVPYRTTDAAIAVLVNQQAKALFGALRGAHMMASSRYMGGVVAGSIAKLPINVLDTDTPGAKSYAMMRVTYTYKDNAIVSKGFAASSAFQTALLNPNYDTLQTPIRAHCTPGQSTEGSEPIWYSFSTQSAECQADIAAESTAIAADRTHLPGPAGFKYPWITQTEANRVFFPTPVALGADTSNRAPAYPQYDQLYSGKGVEANKLVVGLMGGYVTHKAIASERLIQGKYYTADGGMSNDGYVYDNFIHAIQIALSGHAGFVATPSWDANQLHFAVNAHNYQFSTLSYLLSYVRAPSSYAATTDATPAQQDTDRALLLQQIMDRTSKTWLTFEAPASVVAGAQSRPLTLKLRAYFGTDEEDTPLFKSAFKQNDVLAYMGHSSTGHAAFSPDKIAGTDFANSYQLMFINGCVSYNYYDQSFFKLKAGSTKNLDLITNGIEGYFGYEEGTLARDLFNGSMKNYSDLLTDLAGTPNEYGSDQDSAPDPFRVVDGELDNTFDPQKTPLLLK